MKINIYLGLMALGFNAIAQQNPTGNAPPANTAGNVPAIQNAVEKAWYRGGNFSGGSAGTNNIFGTMWNSPIYTKTDGIMRMQMNGTVSNVVNFGANLPKDGFIGIGVPAGFYNGSGGQGPFSLLHLNGNNFLGTPQSGGYRDWMHYGITSTHNQDFMYIGQRSTGGNDVTDAVIGWADNAASGFPGPDNMVFNFLADIQGGSDDLSGTANFGREILRMTGTGQVGIGPRFNNANQPTSTLHQHQENATSSWMQITNQYMNTATAIQTGPTAINATNGFRFEILGNNQKIKNGNAYVYNQEERHLIFSTNHTTPTDAQFTNERMRITSISAPTNLTNGGNATFGVWNPGALTNQDVTRVAISHNPATPVTRPLALLHLGYNTGNTLFPLATPTTDGWRPWMDVGTFASEGTDNAYFGLKKETGFNNDRQDAVISWGDNYSPTNQFGLPTGIDKLRIIFTTPAQGQPAAGPGAMSTADGLEFVRYVPFHNASLGVNDPRTGFGDFENLLPVGTINPGNTIEINSIMNGFNAAANTNVTGSYVGSTGASGLRFRDLTSQSLVSTDSVLILNKVDVNKVLSVDSLGNVILINNSGGSSGFTLGNICSDSIKNPLLNNWEIPLNGHNFVFSGDSTGTDRVGIGTNCFPANKLEIDNAIANTSGLRLTRLTNASPVSGNIPNKVLSVDANGDVIIVNDNIGAGTFAGAQNGTSNVVSATNPTGKVEFGNAVNSTQATLLSDRQIPMNNNTVLFNGLGRVKVGQNAAVLNPILTVVPTFEVNNVNSPNNVGLYINDNGGNSPVNRQGLLIRMNLNNGDQNTTALDLVHSNPASNQNSSSFLIKAKGTDYLTTGVVEKFLLDVTGYAGFNAPSTSYRGAATVIESFGRLGQVPNPYYSDVNPGGTVGYNKALMVNNVINNSEHAVGIQTYCKGESHSATGIIAVGEALGTVNFRTGIGVKATGISNATNAPAYGVFADAYPGTLNAAAPTIGVYGEAKNSTTSNYGIYGKAAVSTAAPVNYAGYFVGDVNIIGNLTLPAGVGSISSDATLKTNIDSLQNALSIIKQLKPKTFNYDTTRYFLKSNSAKNYGLIAQDVEQILPELINEYKMEDLKDSTGNVIATGGNYKGLNYNAFIPILIKGLQEQQSKIDSLKHAVDSLTTKVNTKDSIQDARLAALEAAIDRCCTNNTTRNSNTNINQLDVELSDKDAIVLNQNVPNPFAEQTTITYNVPVSVGKAQLIFFNTNGQVIQTVDIKTRGKGKVNVFASDLSSGLYNYTLVADGKVIDSKKMVRE